MGVVYPGVEKLPYLGDKFYLTLVLLEVIDYGLKGSFPSGKGKKP